jgi:hypothetical protein
MFRALFANPQEALHKRHLVYCVRVVSWLHQDWSGTVTGHIYRLCVCLSVCDSP